MAETRLLTLRPKSSPPPNCAICLGPYIDKCFSDPCMHQFCFNCLLKWSKIKAECPLCKQSFRLIIHNVKSNDEYDEHVVESTSVTDFHLPTEPARHQFHFRTTFTVDTRGEHAIQQMLLSHPLTRGQISFSNYTSSARRRRSSVSSTNFRRSIYTNNMWVSAPPDVTGRYRDISPTFFRNYPAARQRLVPWLNRELNALLYENTMLVMYLVDRIMDYLLRHHICSRSFRLFLSGYLGVKTDHFVHEFYNFMRSPFDMIGYDRHINYTTRPRSPTPFIDVTDTDTIIENEIIVVSDASSDVIETSSQTTTNAPIVIDLDSDETVVDTNESMPSTSVPRPIVLEDDDRSPILPLKLRLKNKRKRKHRRNSKSKRRRARSSSSSSSSSSSESNERGNENRLKRNYTFVNDVCVISSDEDEIQPGNTSRSNEKSSDSDDDLPLSSLVKRSISTALDLSKTSQEYDMNMPSCSFSTTPPLPQQQNFNFNTNDEDLIRPSCSRQIFPSQSQYKINTSVVKSKRKHRRSSSSSVSSSSSSSSSSTPISSSDDSYYNKKPLVKSEIHIKSEQGPSCSTNNTNVDGNMVNILIKNEEPSSMWYFPYPKCPEME